MGLERCHMLEFPKITDPRGNLTFLEGTRQIPFQIRRVFYIYDIPSGDHRGAHAHKTLEQVLVCLSGSLDVLLDDANRTQTIHLNRPWLGLYIPPLIWASEGNFDPGTVYMVLASDFYNEADYHRDYAMFCRAVRSHGG